jgi:hypothetical protein
MKSLGLFLLVLCPLFGQPNAGSTILAFGESFSYLPFRFGAAPYSMLLSDYQYSWEVTANPDGSKSFYFDAYYCEYDEKDPITGIYPFCEPLSIGKAETLGPIKAALRAYYDLRKDRFHHPPAYGFFAAPVHRLTTLVQPAAPVDPQMIFLDGLSYNLVQFDLTTFAMTSSVTLPPQARAFGVRPTATDPENEVWTAHAGTVNEISIADLGSQNVLATIPTPSLDPNNSVPVGIVFTNSGLTALYAVAYYTPDSAANNGVLLVFDVPTRKLRSMLPLKSAPSALLMAPDALTAYLLSSTGNITYYDVLSGTADLTVSTFTPGIAGGYGPPDQVFIHPDGTRLFWNYGPSLVVFDLTTHKIANQFNSGLPMGSALASMQMSQDGSTMWFASALGSVVILDTRYGNILGTFQAMPNGAIFPGPAY